MKLSALILLVILSISISCDRKPEESKTDINPKTSKESKEEKFEVIQTENAEKFLTEYGKRNPEKEVEIVTNLGKISLRLYEETPIHRASFIMLAKRGYFDRSVFYRVVNEFIIQGGDNDDWEIQREKAKIGKYLLKPNYQSQLFHKRGAIALARGYENNPEKLETPFIFFIVQRGKISPEGMDYMVKEEHKTYTPTARQHYIDFGGAPNLDNEHTVFGEVISGMDVVDKIAILETDGKEWPKTTVTIKVNVIK